jgi:hypothetical protein
MIGIAWTIANQLAPAGCGHRFMLLNEISEASYGLCIGRQLPIKKPEH